MFLKNYTPAKKPIFLVLAFALIASVLTGCAGQKLGQKITTVKYYPECYRPIGDLRRQAEEANKATAAGAVIGAISGAATAYFTSGGNKADIVKGAITGGLTGAGLGYLISDEVQAMDQAERFRTYMQVMEMDASNMKQAVAAAKIADSCYNKQNTNLMKNFKAKRISEAEASERLKEITDGTTEARTILRNYADTSVQLANDYDRVITMEKSRPDRAPNRMINQVTTKKAAIVKETRNYSKVDAALDKTLLRCQENRAIIGSGT
ncbi:MAG: hypothetical protein LBR11_09700 [Deltaproteobacteria bacterium]|jgi:hypothetical protein|nr:hypothetical protein [Deltaproteobacteria bacterium]